MILNMHKEESSDAVNKTLPSRDEHILVTCPQCDINISPEIKGIGWLLRVVTLLIEESMYSS